MIESPVTGETPDEVAEICKKAYNLLKDKGWCQGILEDNRGRHCLLGAIRVSIGGSAAIEPGTEYYEEMTLKVIAQLGFNHLGVATLWNDHWGRDVEDVLHLLEEHF
jgi:hypothetical protein